MSVTIKDIFGHKQVMGDVALEVEVEADNGYQLPIIDNTWWMTTTDGSLRNGIEYINKAPLPCDDRKLARIKKLTEAVDTPAAKILKNSHRTSIHVHKNVLDKEPVQVWTGVTAYWLLEPLFFSWFNKDRAGNAFCLRLKDAEGIICNAVRDIKGKYAFNSVASDLNRYAGCNLAAISKYGSVEFRGMEGHLNPERMDIWSTTVHSVFETSLKFFRTPQEVLDTYFHYGWKYIAKLITPQPMLDIILNVKDAEGMVEEHALILTTLAYCTEWHEYAKRQDAAVPKAKKPRGDFPEWAANIPPTWADIAATPAVQPRLRRNRAVTFDPGTTIDAETMNRMLNGGN